MQLDPILTPEERADEVRQLFAGCVADFIIHLVSKGYAPGLLNHHFIEWARERQFDVERTFRMDTWNELWKTGTLR